MPPSSRASPGCFDTSAKTLGAKSCPPEGARICKGGLINLRTNKILEVAKLMCRILQPNEPHRPHPQGTLVSCGHHWSAKQRGSPGSEHSPPSSATPRPHPTLPAESAEAPDSLSLCPWPNGEVSHLNRSAPGSSVPSFMRAPGKTPTTWHGETTFSLAIERPEAQGEVCVPRPSMCSPPGKASLCHG